MDEHIRVLRVLLDDLRIQLFTTGDCISRFQDEEDIADLIMLGICLRRLSVSESALQGIYQIIATTLKEDNGETK